MNSYQPQADESGFLKGTVLEVTRHKNKWVYVVGIESETVITEGGGLFTLASNGKSRAKIHRARVY